MINGLVEWFRRVVWEIGLGEQLEIVAVNVKYKVKIFFNVPKNFGKFSGRVTWKSNLGEQYRREALDY